MEDNNLEQLKHVTERLKELEFETLVSIVDREAQGIRYNSEAVIVATIDGRIITCNTLAEEFTMYGRNEMTGQKIEMFIPFDRQAEHMLRRAEFMKNPRSEAVTREGLRIRRKDGVLVPVRVVFLALHKILGSYIVAAHILK
jgi:PAS domain S-box-containing protein